MKRCGILLAGISLALSAATVAVPSGQSLLTLQTSFQGLSGGVSAEMFQNGAWGVSADGTTIVGSGYGDHAFVWKENTGMVLLPEVNRGPGGITGSTAFAVNQDGTIAAGCVESSAGRPACRWTQDPYSKAWVLEVLGDLAGGGFGSNCYAMSADGNVLAGFVNFASADYTQAARWTLTEQAWGIEYLGDLPGGTFNSEAWGCSTDASVIVGRSVVYDWYGTRAVRWSASTGMVDLGAIGKRKWSQAKGCSADGNVVVGFTCADMQKNQVAFRWSASTGMISLGLLSDGTASEARAVSPDGSIVVGRCVTRKTTKAFIWDAANGMRAVVDVLAARGVYPPQGWSLLDAYGIATPAPGFVVVVGRGRNPQGYFEAWRAVIEQ